MTTTNETAIIKTNGGLLDEVLFQSTGNKSIGDIENTSKAIPETKEKTSYKLPKEPKAKKEKSVPTVKAEVVTGALASQDKKFDFELAELTKCTDSIRSQILNIAKSFCKIGFNLWKIKDGELYKAMGFKNISEYGESVLNFKKSSTANYISICEKFSERDKKGLPSAKLVVKFEAYSYTQLSELLTLPDSTLACVTPDMKIKDIRNLKSSSKLISVSSPHEALPQKKEYTPVEIWNRAITEENLLVLVKMLKENFGKDIQVIVG